MHKILNAEGVRRVAAGQWPAVLIALGVPAEVVSRRRNQPCPACGGHDRFQFIDKGAGRFVCRALDSQGGDGFALVRHWLGCDFPAALRAVASVLGLSADTVPPLPSPTPTAAPAAAKRDQRAAIARLWAEALPVRPDDPVGRYLTARGLVLPDYPLALRHHPALDYWAQVDDRPVKVGAVPAMLAVIRNAQGEAVALHRVYLSRDGGKARLRHPVSGEPLDAKKLLTAHDGAMRGVAVPLYAPAAGVLALAEGIETALAVRHGSGLPCWATVSAWGLSQVLLPEAVREVYVMADHDASGTGLRAANALARRLVSEGRTVRVAMPERVGADWLDVLNDKQRQEAG